MRLTQITLKDRLKIIKFHNQGFTVTEISNQCGINFKIVNNTIKRKKYYSNLNIDTPDRIRLPFLDKDWLRILEDAIYDHIKFMQSRGDYVYGSTIQFLARRIAEDQGKPFNASNGWVENFKRRFQFTLPLRPLNL